MKNKLKNIFKPRQSFEDWASENNIVLNEKKEPNKKPFFRLALYGLSLILVAVFIPLAILSNKPSNKIYSSQDVNSKLISISDYYANDNLIFFKPERVIQVEKVGIDVARENESLLLSYNITSAIITAKDETDAYIIDLIARTYSFYEFHGITNFTDLKSLTVLSDIKVLYKIKTEWNIAFISFRLKEVDYFITIKGYSEATEITPTTIILLINDLLN